MKVLCVIPARKGSKGLPNKHMLHIAGRPVIEHTIETAKKSKLITDIVVSTDCPKIEFLAKLLHVDVIRRPPELATDNSPIEETLIHAIEVMAHPSYYDYVVWLQADCPCRAKGMIDTLAGIFEKVFDNYDSAVTVEKITKTHPEWLYTIDDDGQVNPLKKTNKYKRQDLEELFRLNGSVVIIKTDVLLASKNKEKEHIHDYMGKNKLFWTNFKPEYSMSIDNEHDYKILKLIMENS